MPPFRLRKAPKRDLYWVVDDSNKHYSKDPMPKAKAILQQKALYAAYGRKEKQLKGGVKLEIRQVGAVGAGEGTRYRVEDVDPVSRREMAGAVRDFDTLEEAEAYKRQLEDQLVAQASTTMAVLSRAPQQQTDPQRRSYMRAVGFMAPIGESPVSQRRRLESGQLLGRTTVEAASKLLRKEIGMSDRDRLIPRMARTPTSDESAVSGVFTETPTSPSSVEGVSGLSSTFERSSDSLQFSPPSVPPQMSANVGIGTPTNQPTRPIAQRPQRTFFSAPQQQPSNIGRVLQFSAPQSSQPPSTDEDQKVAQSEDEEERSSVATSATPTTQESASTVSTPEQPSEFILGEKRKRGSAVLKKRPNETELDYQNRLLRVKQQEERLAKAGITPEQRMSAIIQSNIERKKQQLKDIESSMAVQKAYETDPEIIAKKEAIAKRSEENKAFEPLLSTLLSIGDIAKQSGILPKPLATAYEMFRPDVEGEQAQQQLMAEQRQQKEAFGQQYGSQLEQQAQQLRSELGMAGSGRFGKACYFGEY